MINRLIDHAKQSTTDTLKTTSKKVIRKTAEETGDLIGKNISNGITNISRSSLQNKERKIYISRRKTESYWWSEINIIV